MLKHNLPVPEFAEVSREVRHAPPRYRNEIGKYTIHRASNCAACGRCVELCQYGVHVRPDGYKQLVRPFDYRCIGPECAEGEQSCIKGCPQQALSIDTNPAFETLGDYRWTPELILSTWHMAETGQSPPAHLESETGASGGGFDRLRFRFPETADGGKGDSPLLCEAPSGPFRQKGTVPFSALRREDISTELVLNRRDDGRAKLRMDVPWYGGGMSFGSTNIRVLVAKARVAKAFHGFSCTGEGGYPERFIPYADHMITQVATGLFGVREETIQRAPIVEFKYAQGAKPGLGGHLLGDKNTPAVAAMREAVVGTSLFSPFPFHSVYSVEDHKKHLDWIAHVNPRALLSAKVSTPVDVDMVAVGVYYAGGHIVHLDGSYGGTGAAPNIAKKNIAMPIEYAINRVHQFLVNEGIREKVTVMASGGVRTPSDVAKAIALGADGVVIGTAELMAVGCIRCGCCESGRGCARGIATTDSELLQMVSVEWCTQRLVNMYTAWQRRLIDILYRLGLDSVAALRGRTDLLMHLDYENAV
jgi:ferredoxin